jgi:hypothetical protein
MKRDRLAAFGRRLLSGVKGAGRGGHGSTRRRARTPARTFALGREDVLWAYRLLLDREPESERVIEDKIATLGSWRALRATILHSPEFRAANPEFRGFDESCVVVKELPGGLRTSST